ncbi:MAG: tetratricopeptide repeat protein [Dehalogenimonas sp.]
MAYNDDEQAKLKKGNAQAAIEFAMAGRWKEAAEANQAILEIFPNDLEALNRLGRAQMELGEYDAARKAYSKSRELDPYNSIADRNLKRLEVLSASGARPAKADGQGVPAKAFIEEIGKAGVVVLSKLASREVLVRVDAGDKVNLRPGPGVLFVDSMAGDYLGVVDARTALRLLKLMKGGNRYSATVVSSDDNKLAVMIREIYQHPSQAGHISFPARLSAAAVRKPDLDDTLADDEDTENGQEEIEKPAVADDEAFSEDDEDNDDDDDDDDDDELEV